MEKPNYATVLLSIMVGLTLLSSAVQPVNVFASASERLGDGIRRDYHPQTGKLSFLGADILNPIRVGKAMEWELSPEERGYSNLEMYAREFGIQDAQNELSVMKSTNEDDRQLVRYQQVFNGIPVLAGELNVNMKEDGSLLSINGEVSPDLNLDIRPRIIPEAAKRVTLLEIAKAYNLGVDALTVSEPELWIFDERLMQENATQPVQLVWRMEVTSDADPLREFVLVNAQTGKISLHFNQIDTAWRGRLVGDIVRLDKDDYIESPVESAQNVDSLPASVSLAGLNAPRGDPDPNLDRFVAPTGTDSGMCMDHANPCATINYAIGVSLDGDTISVAEGTYTGTGNVVVPIGRPVNLSGGWNAAFDAQVGFSTIDGEKARMGIYINDVLNPANTMVVNIDHFYVTRTTTTGISDSETVTIEYSAFFNNLGNGIEHGGGVLSIINTTISENRGTGIYLNSGTTNLRFVTISNNQSGYGAGIYKYTGYLNFDHIILDKNSNTPGGGQCNGVSWGGFNSLGHNIINGTCGPATEQPTDHFNTDPLLGIFLPTHGYQPLRPTSLAVDGGDDVNCEPTDQRGMPRVDIGSDGTACDIGAYEYTPPGAAASIWPAVGNNQHTSPGAAYSLPLTAIVLDAQGNPVSGVDVTFTAPAAGPSAEFSTSGNNVDGPIPTDAGGTAISSTLTANSELGIFTVSADAGLGTTADFTLENLAWYVSASGSDLNTCKSPGDACGTINGAILKATSGDLIFIAEGIYTGSGTEVVSINKSLRLSGGWNAAFDAQTGYSTVDGQGLRRGIYFGSTGNPSTIDRFEIVNSLLYGINIDHTTGALTISRSMIHHNPGRGIVNSGTLIIEYSTIHDNIAEHLMDGGGVTNSGYLTIRNSVISKNQAYTGGGVRTDYAHPVVIENSTISENKATLHGGGIEGGANMSINNSIIADNRANEGVDCYGAIVSHDYNIIGDTSTCSLDVSGAGHDKLNVDPQLTIFLPVQGYPALLPTSPAIDAVDLSACPAIDIRGMSRSDGHCDIGAYEYASPGSPDSLWLFGGSPQVAMTGEKFLKPLRVVVVDDQGSPVPSTTVTLTAPDTGASGTFENTSDFISTSTTDAGGLATAAAFIANTEVGSYIVTASVTGVSSTMEFSLHNGFWTVALTGDDSNDCLSPATPCATLEGILSKPLLADGNEIRVAAGTYDVSSDYTISRNVFISGGWDAGFVTQTGMMVLQEPISIGPSARVSIERLLIQNYKGSSMYHGVIENAGYLTITDSAFRNNMGYGITNAGTLVLERVSLTNMDRGIFNQGTATLVNVTISGNKDLGIMNYPGGNILVKNSTIAYNTGSNGGGIRNQDGTFRIANSIVAKNTGTINNSGDCYGRFISDGYNLIGYIGRDMNGRDYYECRADWLAFDLIGYVTYEGVSHKINPLISPLVERPAGSSVWIHPLKFGSPAIDNGNEGTPGSIGFACPTTDQLGTVRPQGGNCDIGAVEYKFGTYPVNSLLVTYTAKNETILPGTKLCESSNATCSSTDARAKIAHRYAYSTYSQYKLWHGRNSLDGNGLQIMSIVHYDSGLLDSFWNGYALIYGDGYGYAMADDIVAHEYTHGVTQFESNLFPWYQSGAIGESFADLWGEAVDQANHLGNDTAAVKWLIGEDISGLGAIRSMSKPSDYHDPDSITHPLYCDAGDCLKDNGGVHTNSGVNNKAVYLLVNGGTFNGKAVRALGWTKTLAIYYEAQTNLLTSGSDYLDLYNALYQACYNEVGANGITLADCTEVRDATIAVRMNSRPSTNFNPDVTFCPAGTSRATPDLFFEDFETGSDGWIMGALYGESAWGISGNNSKSGAASLWANDMHETSDSYAATKGVPLPAGSKPYLHFSHTFNFEVDGTRKNDGGVLEYSINNGSTWVDAKSLFSAGRNYIGVIGYGTDNKLRGRLGFVGASHGYVDSRYNLATLSGKTIRFRWRMGTDTAVGVRGWHVDDVRIYTCVSTPSVPTLISPANGAEQTNLQPVFDWSNSTPDLHHYQLQLAKNSTFTLNLVTNNDVLTSTFTLGSDLNAGIKYYWRVRAFNAAGKASAWSAVWSFNTPP